MRKFITELRRRNVVKVGIVYLVVAWVVMQVADVMFPALRLPLWTVTLVAALVIIGFPIALMLAWAFELTPAGVTRDKFVADAGANTPTGLRPATAVPQPPAPQAPRQLSAPHPRHRLQLPRPSSNPSHRLY